MKRHKKHWTEQMFIEKADMWLHWMNLGWKRAPMITRQIKKLLKKHGISRGKILELGCGNGRISINMAKRGFDVTGVDISQQYIEDAGKKAARMRARTRFIRGDFRRIDKFVRGKFDVAISIWTSLGFYDRSTDEKIFKKIAQLLKKKGIFLILYTMSRERLLQFFMPNLVEETTKYVKLNKAIYDSYHSVLNTKWLFYKKVNKDLIYENEIEFSLRVYALHEFVEMAEKAGLAFSEAYHSVETLEPARSDSPANLVFQKP